MCYFTFCFRLHKVVTAICLTHLNCHYSDVLGDDILGCTQCRSPSWLQNNKVFLARDSNTAVIFSWKPTAVAFFLHDIHKLLTHNMPPFVSLISAFYPFFLLLRHHYGNLSSHHSREITFLFPRCRRLPVQLLYSGPLLPLASDKGSRNRQRLFVTGTRQGWHTLDYTMQRRAEVR